MPPLNDSSSISRRAFLQLAGVGTASAVAVACNVRGVRDARAETTSGRLSARPRTPTGAITPGEHRLSLGDERDGLLYVPSGYDASRPATLVVMLHGAGGSAIRAVRPFRELADDVGLVLVAPESRGSTWDAIRSTYGPDIAFIDRVLESVFSRVAVDPDRVVVEGFSDGATYAIGIGLTNGDLFKRVIAFSPGFIPAIDPHGRPSIFISHGTRDAILPIDQCSRRIVPELHRARYEVRYREFDGPHAVPLEIAREAITWMRDSAG